MPFDSISSVWRHFRAPGAWGVFTGAKEGEMVIGYRQKEEEVDWGG